MIAPQEFAERPEGGFACSKSTIFRCFLFLCTKGPRQRSNCNHSAADMASEAEFKAGTELANCFGDSVSVLRVKEREKKCQSRPRLSHQKRTCRAHHPEDRAAARPRIRSKTASAYRITEGKCTKQFADRTIVLVKVGRAINGNKDLAATRSRALPKARYRQPEQSGLLGIRAAYRPVRAAPTKLFGSRACKKHADIQRCARETLRPRWL